MQRAAHHGSAHPKTTTSPHSTHLSVDTATAAGDDARAGMRSVVEMRRRSSIDSPPALATARLMERDMFSLNEAVGPMPVSASASAEDGMAGYSSGPTVSTGFFDLPNQDQRNFLLLCALYFLQGIPMGLATGSVPFLLKPHMSYGQIGVFSLASYPYSLKLLWSPIVDAVWNREFGRRKSWITPIQTLSGLSMIYLGHHIDRMMAAAGANGGAGIWGFTGWWFLLVFLCATQDIAVDGWAISLISPRNVSYASTAQTVGLTAGHFLSYTVFLALNAPDFPNKWFRAVPADVGLLSLGGYLVFWGWLFLIGTAALAFLKKEDRTRDKEGILSVYRSMWGVLRLHNIQVLMIVHLIAKIGFQANDGVTSLKMVDNGFGQDNMALVVLIDFPFEISLGYYAGKWSTEYTPMRLWCWAFVGRLVAALVAQATVAIMPAPPVPAWYVLVVILEHVASTFMSTVMFVAVSAFHARVADPVIGGTYMTLLATVSNLGGTFPRFFVLRLVDAFTRATCHPPADPAGITNPVTTPFECVMEPAKAACRAGGGTCTLEREGYYYTNILCVLFGAVTFFLWIRPTVLGLQRLPLAAWRVAGSGRGMNVRE